MNPIKVFACEAQPIVIEGLAAVLAQDAEFAFAGSSAGLTGALAALQASRPDVLLLDRSVELNSILQFISEVKKTLPGCHSILWVNELAEADGFRAIQGGARGILKKTVAISTLRACLRAVSQGEVWIESSPVGAVASSSNRRSSPRLTPREKDIVHHLCGGLKNKEIATALAITAGTVKVHLMHIFEKTGVKDRFELASQGRRLLGI